MKHHHWIATGLLGFCAIGADAQTMKPGLWEVTQKMQFGSPEINAQMAAAQEQMAKMPPEQRKMMQDMMAKQGVSMGAGGPNSMVIKMCMTQDMIDKNEVPTQQGDCTSTRSPRAGNSMKFSFSCTKPPSSGEGQMTFNSADSYTMKMSVTSSPRGKPEKMDMDMSGQWLGANCGDVKPFAMPKK